MRKILAAFAALTLGLSGVLALSAPASATGNGNGGGQGHVPVNVCHATSSDTNPFVFITVDDDSVKLKGHLMHRDDPNKTWKSDGVWNGVFHSAGDAKADRIESYTGTDGVFHELDGTFSDCGSGTPKPDPVVDTNTDTRKSCEAGVEEQVTTTTTDWVFEDGQWVKGKPVVEVGNWTFVRDLTDQERNRLECDPVVTPPQPQAVIDSSCGTAEVTLSNPLEEQGAEQGDAEFTIVVDGVATTDEPIEVEANGTKSFTFDFAEDSGDHVVEVFTDGVKEPVASATVGSDCEPPVEEPTYVSVDFINPTCEIPEAGIISDYDKSQATIKVDGQIAPGQTVTVTFTAKEGFYIKGDSVFEYTYSAVPDDCEPVIVEVTAAAPGFTDPTCDLNQAGLNLPDQDGIVYTVNGDVAPGESVNVVATLADGVENTVLVGDTVWTHTYGDKATDCGKTPPPNKPEPKPEPPVEELPHTGGSIAAPLTAALGLLGLGTLLLVASRRRKGLI